MSTTTIKIKVRQQPFGRVPKKGAMFALRLTRFGYAEVVRKLLECDEEFKSRYTGANLRSWSMPPDAFERLVKAVIPDSPYEIEYE